MSDSKSILIVEDNEQINNLMCEALTKHGYSCTQAFSGTEGILIFKQCNFDLVITDLMMPGMSGEELAHKIKEEKNIPIIVASAKTDIDTKVNMLCTDADDYLPKPFEISELIARVEVQLRHASKMTGDNSGDNGSEDILSHNGLKLNRSTYEVFLEDKQLTLTKQEFKILELFLLYPSKVFSKQNIYEYAWDDFYIGEDKTINVHISNIRTKMKKITDTEYIETVWGFGFRLAK